jgi:hypothetical protein
MHYRMMIAVGALAFTFAASACSQEATVERRDVPGTDAARVDQAAELQRQRDQDLSKMDDRVAAIERSYQERVSQPRGTSGGAATAGLQADVKSDMEDLKKAVDNLRTTTPENWWDRHQSALKTAVDEVEGDVARFTKTPARHDASENTRVADASGQPVSTAPFTSTRDKFVGSIRTRLSAMDSALDNVKATGERKTALNDLHARVDKLGEDIDRLTSASAEDWWDLSKARVNDYIERFEKSVGRLDDNR